MKKTLLFITLASLAIMVTFSGCKKDEDEYTPEPLPTATITGKVWADLNTANDTSSTGGYQYHQEYAPTGTKIIAVINTAELVDNPIAGYNYQLRTYEAAVDASGNYSLSIPARGNTVTVNIKPVDFTYDQVIMDVYPATKTDRKIYTPTQPTVQVVANQVKVQDILYTAN